MCIAVPVKIVKILGDEALAQIEGIQHRINIELLSELEKGDYVLLHAGCAIQKINEREAVRTLELMNQLSGLGMKDESK